VQRRTIRVAERVPADRSQTKLDSHTLDVTLLNLTGIERLARGWIGEDPPSFVRGQFLLQSHFFCLASHETLFRP
jgi:hypothetical protein